MVDVSANDLLRCILVHLRVKHRLPWSIVMDWSWEVYDAEGVLVAKFCQHEYAQAFVELAQRHDAEQADLVRQWEEEFLSLLHTLPAAAQEVVLDQATTMAVGAMRNE